MLRKLLLCVFYFVVTPSWAYSEAELKLQLEELAGWWAGEYDNNEQIVRQSGGGLSEPVFEPHFRIHSHIVPVELPSLGDHVFYIEEYKNNDPSNLYRIRLMSLRVSAEDNGIVGTLYAPPDASALVGTHRKADEITEKQAAQWRKFSGGCELVIEFQNGRYVGGMRDKACRVETTRGSGNKDGYFHYEFSVGPENFWFRDAIRRLDDDSVTWQMAGDSADFFMADKVQWFACDVNYNAAGDMTATERLETVELHDQGGVAEIAYPDRTGLKLILHNREFRAGATDRFRILRLHEGNNPVPIAYGYAIVPAERFGFNLGWFYTLCRAKQ